MFQSSVRSISALAVLGACVLAATPAWADGHHRGRSRECRSQRIVIVQERDCGDKGRARKRDHCERRRHDRGDRGDRCDRRDDRRHGRWDRDDRREDWCDPCGGSHAGACPRDRDRCDDDRRGDHRRHERKRESGVTICVDLPDRIIIGGGW